MIGIENKYGYLLLSYRSDEDLMLPVLIKANKITAIRQFRGDTRIYAEDNTYDVVEDIDEILEQLDNIHPSLR